MQISQGILECSEFSVLIEWADVPVETGKVPSSACIYFTCMISSGANLSHRAKDKLEIHL